MCAANLLHAALRRLSLLCPLGFFQTLPPSISGSPFSHLRDVPRLSDNPHWQVNFSVTALFEVVFVGCGLFISRPRTSPDALGPSSRVSSSTHSYDTCARLSAHQGGPPALAPSPPMARPPRSSRSLRAASAVAHERPASTEDLFRTCPGFSPLSPTSKPPPAATAGVCVEPLVSQPVSPRGGGTRPSARPPTPFTPCSPCGPAPTPPAPAACSTGKVDHPRDNDHREDSEPEQPAPTPEHLVEGRGDGGGRSPLARVPEVRGVGVDMHPGEATPLSPEEVEERERARWVVPFEEIVFGQPIGQGAKAMVARECVRACVHAARMHHMDAVPQGRCSHSGGATGVVTSPVTSSLPPPSFSPPTRAVLSLPRIGNAGERGKATPQCGHTWKRRTVSRKEGRQRIGEEGW